MKKLSYFEKLKMLYGDDISEEWLLHYGKYAKRTTLGSAAKLFFESIMSFEPKVRKRAEQLGLI